jgi:hypothetical protein
MPNKHSPILWIALLLFGCGSLLLGSGLVIYGTGWPLGSPNGHGRPQGHQDTTLDVSPTDEAIVFNATGAGGRDLYLLRLDDLSVTRIAETPEYEVWPSFSVDGRYLVYCAGVPGDRADHVFKRFLAPRRRRLR